MSSTTRCQVHTRYTHACDVRVVDLEHGGGALGIFKSPVSTYNQSWTSVRVTNVFIFFLPEQAWRAANAARGAKRLVHLDEGKASEAGAAKIYPVFDLSTCLA